MKDRNRINLTVKLENEFKILYPNEKPITTPNFYSGKKKKKKTHKHTIQCKRYTRTVLTHLM